MPCAGIVVRFGGVVALNAVDLKVAKGGITAIIGPNGAGKTTLLNTISGIIPCTQGRIKFRGEDVLRLPAHDRAKAGMVRTFQNLEVFGNMTVLENVMTGRHRLVRYSLLDTLLKTRRYRREERLSRQKAEEKLEFVGLFSKSAMPAQDLPFGNQRMLELARALAAEPDLLLLDEPAAGLNIRETKVLGDLVERIRSVLGITIVLVEHDMDLVMRVSDMIIVINFGEVIARGTPGEVQRDQNVIAAYLGEEEEPTTGGYGDHY